MPESTRPRSPHLLQLCQSGIGRIKSRAGFDRHAPRNAAQLIKT
jgi:hypothetical protein